MNQPLHRKKKVFLEGPIPPSFIAESIEKHSSQTRINGHGIYLEQVQEYTKNGQSLLSRRFGVDEVKADDLLYQLREEIFSRFSLTCLHIYQSLGEVRVGAISLFIFTSSEQENVAMEALSELIRRFKAEVPLLIEDIFE
jgi:molybdopterin synthase catalytic subunit